MPCRIGISMNPDERRAHWERECLNLRNWQVLGRFPSKSAAQAHETSEAARLGCDASPGGAGDEHATWYVYYFEHDGGC